jgi:hypothetical protein
MCILLKEALSDRYLSIINRRFTITPPNTPHLAYAAEIFNVCTSENQEKLRDMLTPEEQKLLDKGGDLFEQKQQRQLALAANQGKQSSPYQSKQYLQPSEGIECNTMGRT